MEDPSNAKGAVPTDSSIWLERNRSLPHPNPCEVKRGSKDLSSKSEEVAVAIPSSEALDTYVKGPAPSRENLARRGSDQRLYQGVVDAARPSRSSINETAEYPSRKKTTKSHNMAVKSKDSRRQKHSREEKTEYRPVKKHDDAGRVSKARRGGSVSPRGNNPSKHMQDQFVDMVAQEAAHRDLAKQRLEEIKVLEMEKREQETKALVTEYELEFYRKQASDDTEQVVHQFKTQFREKARVNWWAVAFILLKIAALFLYRCIVTVSALQTLTELVILVFTWTIFEALRGLLLRHSEDNFHYFWLFRFFSSWSPIISFKEHTFRRVPYGFVPHGSLRADAISLGDLKHTDAMYGRVLYEQRNYFGIVVEQKIMTVSFELLAQLTVSKNLRMLSTPKLVAERLERAGGEINSVNINRYLMIGGQYCVQDTIQVAHAIYMSMIESYARLPFINTPA